GLFHDGPWYSLCPVRLAKEVMDGFNIQVFPSVRYRELTQLPFHGSMSLRGNARLTYLRATRRAAPMQRVRSGDMLYVFERRMIFDSACLTAKIARL